MSGSNQRFSFITMSVACVFFSCDPEKVPDELTEGNSYYVNVSGNDSNSGSMDSPWRSIAKVNEMDLNPGDTIYLQSGQTFAGTLQVDSSDSGTYKHPVVITSRGGGKASIHAGNFSSIVIRAAKYVVIENLHLIGSGRKEGNIESGIVVHHSTSIGIDSLNVEGFQKSGALVYSSSDVTIENVYAHNNGAAGITVTGSKKSDCRNIAIRHCLAENNPGDPTRLDNHSGNGIIVGPCRQVTVEYCVATNNGWDMPRIGNGPVGIWAYEADSVTIQHCISYRNKTAKGAEDGGGFDLDGGVTNSVIQYCLSYENEGSGFGIFQYNGASAWRNNTVRFNISENDGLVSRGHSGIFVWNGSNDETQFTDLFCYNNIVYNTEGVAIHFDEHSKRQRFYFYNNVFIAKDELIKGLSINDTFAGNNWWSLASGFNMGGVKDFNTWTEQTGHEVVDGVMRGLNVNPDFENVKTTTITAPTALVTFLKYSLPSASPLRTQGLELRNELGIETGSKDFNQNPLPLKGIGASF